MSSHNFTSLAAVTSVISFDNTLGVLLIGALFSMSLWGIACAQTYEYFMNNSDGLLQRSIVALLWTITTFSSALDGHMVYYSLVTNFANPSALLKPVWSMNSYGPIAGVSNAIIRIMFARRIYHFGRKNIILVTWIIGITICNLVVLIVETFGTFGVAHFGRENISRLLYAASALGVTADLSVAIALCWLLQSSKTGFRSSDSIVNVLMAYIVNTGALVVLDSTAGMILYATMPRNLIFFAVYMLLNKLYANAYLASLNARVKLREKNWNSSLPLERSDDKLRALRNRTVSITFQTTIQRNVNGIDVEGDVLQRVHGTQSVVDGQGR